MAWKKIYRAYRNFAILFHIGIFLLVFLAILPVAIKTVTVENVGDALWSFDGKNVIIDVPVTIKNGGIYDINDIKINFDVDNRSYNFISSHQGVGSIYSGTERTIDVKIPIDLEKIYNLEAPTFYHFYNYDNFYIKFSLSLKYMLDMVDFKTNYDGVVRWEPIIKEFETYPPSMINESGSMIKIEVPYTINTAHYLTGTAEFSGKVEGEGNIGTFEAKFPLGRRYNGHLEFEFNSTAGRSLITHSQELHLTGNVSIMGFNVPLNTDYYWGAPLNNLHVELLNNGTVHYSFQNDANFDMNLHISKDYYRNGTLVYHEEESIHVAPGEEVNRYEAMNVNQVVDRVIVTFSDENTGVYYQEVIEL